MAAGGGWRQRGAAGLRLRFVGGRQIWVCPLWRWATGRWVYEREGLIWILIFLAHLKLDTTTITHVHIAR